MILSILGIYGPYSISNQTLFWKKTWDIYLMGYMLQTYSTLWPFYLECIIA